MTTTKPPKLTPTQARALNYLNDGSKHAGLISAIAGRRSCAGAVKCVRILRQKKLIDCDHNGFWITEAGKEALKAAP